MKGYGIEIKNNLLEGKHIEAMGASVWLYMWYIDKMTSVGEDGTGLVLGGKPIIFEDDVDLGIPRRTYFRWLAILRKAGYVNTKRTPKGIVVSVNKAFKRFGKKTSDVPKVAHQEKERDMPKMVHPEPKVAHRYTKSGTSNIRKTITIDNTVDNTSIATTSVAPEKPFIFSKYIEDMFTKQDQKIRIIAGYWVIKDFSFDTQKQAQAAIRRSLRAAERLAQYDMKKVGDTLRWLRAHADFKWTLETVEKYIDEDLEALAGKGKKINIINLDAIK